MNNVIDKKDRAVVVGERQGDIAAYITSSKLQIPLVSKWKLEEKRMVHFEAHRYQYIGIGSNDLRVLRIFAKFYRKLGLPIEWKESSILKNIHSSNIYVSINLPLYIGDTYKQLLGNTLDMLEMFTKLQLDKVSNRCNRCGNSGAVFHYPNLCMTDLQSINLEDLVNILDGNLDISKARFDSANSFYNIMAAILPNYRTYKSYLTNTESPSCKICNTKIQEPSYTTDMLCSECASKVDWKKYEAVYKNKMVEWEEFLTPEIYKQFLKPTNDNGVYN